MAIVVTGATGQLGQGVVDALLARVPAGRIVASVRDPAKAAMRGCGVTVRRGDFAEPDNLPAAFVGAEQVLVISADKLGDEALQLHRAAIRAAVTAGAGRSHAGARMGSPFAPADQHARTEADLAAAGVAWTAFRNSFYAESLLMMVGGGLRMGELRTPKDGPVAWTARADLAEAGAAILTGDSCFDGATPPLTAADAPTVAQVAEIASDALGRAIRHTIVSDAARREERVAAGTPPVCADMLLGTFAARRAGDFAATDSALGQLLGRAPRSLAEVLRASASWPLRRVRRRRR